MTSLNNPDPGISGRISPEQSPLVFGNPVGALRLRPSGDRFLTELGWLHSRHSFSFGHHHDPHWERFGPLRVINDDIIQPASGFGLHPHRDMEIVTVMVEGRLEHRDSLGNGACLEAGEVQRMTAGTGITHSEMNAAAKPCRLLQIWIEPRRSGLAPSYSQKRIEPANTWTTLIAPEAGGIGTGGCLSESPQEALTVAQDVTIWRAQPGRGEVLALPLRQGCRGWLQLISGAVMLQTTGTGGPEALALQHGDGIGFAAARLPSVQATKDSDLLLLQLP
ncbi:MAG: pirin family protein [Synechococcus sp. ELA057]